MAKNNDKTAPKTSTKAPAAEKGLRKPQVRILKALSKSGDVARDRKWIAEKAPVDVASCVEYLGSHDDAVRKANDAKHFPSLITLCFVKFGPSEVEGGVAYVITAAGKKALEKAEKTAATK